MKSMVWGVIIIVIGLSVLLGAIFGINIPIIKVLFGLFLLYMGIKVLFGAFDFNFQFSGEKRASDHEAVFANSVFQYPNAKDTKEYVTVFGRSELDLTAATDLSTKSLEAVTVFGESVIYVKKGTPLRVVSNTVFGKSDLPGKNISAFGKFEYQTPGLQAADPALNLEVTAVFAGVRVVEKE
jgi:hypothetical protein